MNRRHHRRVSSLSLPSLTLAGAVVGGYQSGAINFHRLFDNVVLIGVIELITEHYAAALLASRSARISRSSCTRAGLVARDRIGWPPGRKLIELIKK